jgi:hypothetical protein
VFSYGGDDDRNQVSQPPVSWQHRHDHNGGGGPYGGDDDLDCVELAGSVDEEGARREVLQQATQQHLDDTPQQHKTWTWTNTSVVNQLSRLTRMTDRRLVRVSDMRLAQTSQLIRPTDNG